MKRIKTADQLRLFLEAVAKEATIKAKDKLKEDIDKEVEYFAKGLKTTKRGQSGYSRMMPLVEIEEDEESEMPNEEPAASAEQPEASPPAEQPEASSETKPKAENKANIDIPLTLEEPEFEDITGALGWIRAGASIKGDMKTELSTYVNGLDMPELKALYAMLASIANILHKEIPGEKGQDPEDPPLNLVIDDPEVEKEEDSGSSQSASTDSGSDDAPIKVGQAQSLNEMRRAVKKLMEK